MVTFVSAYYECLNCKFLDTNAGFLFSYSYCENEILDDRGCFPDSWNIINKNAKCTQKDFKTGWNLDIVDDCRADENIGECTNFDSEPEMVGVYIN